MDSVQVPHNVALLSGAVAGLSVDVSLFPLDTVKTRLQSAKGFWDSGGFRGIYSGLGSVMVGSMPGAALFFATYEFTKLKLMPHFRDKNMAWCHMIAASGGEVAACIVRVPTEVVKQRAQAKPELSSVSVLTTTVRTEGIRGLYRGYTSTVMREVPFSLIQFPIWEYLKVKWRTWQNRELSAWQSGVCGAISGGIGAGITTPLDVAKTRIMLANSGSSLAKGNIGYAVMVVWKENGVRGLYAGLIPRVLWIAIGGAIFLGMYDKAKITLLRYSEDDFNDS